MAYATLRFVEKEKIEMLWNRFDRDREKLNPYDNDCYLVEEGLSDHDEIVAAVRQNDVLYREESRNIRQARGLEYYFTRSRLVFNPMNWFGFAVAGWVTARKKPRVVEEALRWPAYQEAAAGIEEEKLKNTLVRDGQIDAWLDCDHSTPNWNNLLKLGFSGLRERAREYREAKRQSGTLSLKAEKFYEGVDIAYGAVLQLLDRFIAHIVSVLDSDDRVPEIHRALSHIRYNPPANLYEVLLFSYLYHWTCEFGEGIQVRTLGNMDEIYRPYYEKDLREGLLSRDQAKELFKYFFATFDYQANYYGQPATLGGTLLNGETAVNDLTYVMLEAYDESNIISPKLQMLVAKTTPDTFIKNCFDMSRRGHNSMVFLNEDLGKAIFEKLGGAEDLKTTRVGTSGCYNFSYGDLLNAPSHARINLPKVLDMVFADEIGLAGMKSFEDFYNGCLEKYRQILENCVRICNWFDSIADQVNPSNIYSGSVMNALEKADDMFMSGAKYNPTAIIISCPATLFDSLAMVKKYVFDNHVLSLQELKKALDADWEGYENLRLTVLADHDKWGNNIEWVDNIAVSIYTQFVREINSRRNKRGGTFTTCGDTINYDIRFKDKVRATPDGKKAKETLAKSLIANRGQDREGLTQLINSVTKLPSLEMHWGAPFDYMIHPSAVQGEEGLTAMTGILRTFFAQGGYSFMGNVMDAQTMLKAQKDPENYKNLQVRLCGWNVHFNDLLKEQQDQLIKQAASL